MSQPIEIWITGTIGQGTATLAAVAAALKAAGASPVTVHINSEGGHATEGLAIYEALRAHPGRVHVTIEGVAASAASLIAMAGETREIRKSGFVMIHDPLMSGASGAAKDMRRNAELLENIAESYAAVYAERAGLQPEEARRLMEAETWLNAADALELNFVTDIVRERKAEEAAAILARLDLARLSRAPSRLRAAVAKAQTQAPKGSTMTNRNSFTTNRHRPAPSPKVPKLTAREEKLALEHLRRQIAKLEAQVAAPSKVAASATARGSALPPEAKLELDRKMGLLDGRRECFVSHGGTKLQLGGIRAAASRSAEDLAKESEEVFNQERDRKGSYPEPHWKPEPWSDEEFRRRFIPPPDGGEPSARAHDREELARKMGLLDGGAPHVHATETKLTFRR